MSKIDSWTHHIAAKTRLLPRFRGKIRDLGPWFWRGTSPGFEDLPGIFRFCGGQVREFLEDTLNLDLGGCLTKNWTQIIESEQSGRSPKRGEFMHQNQGPKSLVLSWKRGYATFSRPNGGPTRRFSTHGLISPFRIFFRL